MDEPTEATLEVPTKSADAEVRQHLIDSGVLTPGETVAVEATPRAPESEMERKSRKTRAVERATAELRRENEAQRRENEELKRKLESVAAAPKAEAAPAPAEAGKPRRADFQSDEDFEAAFTDFVLRERAAADRQNAQRAHFEQLTQNYVAQVQAAKQKYGEDEWNRVVGQEVRIGESAQWACLGLENGAEVIFWLGLHPAEAAKLAELHPASAAASIGRISQFLLSSSGGEEMNGGGEQPEYRRPSRPKLPRPVETVNTSGTSGASTFKEIAARPAYAGKAADLKAAAARER